MNKNKPNKDFSKRFDQEAEQGFLHTPGSEAYFNELENPFAQKKYKVVNRKVNPRLLVIELFLMATLILLLKYTWIDSETVAVQPPVEEKEKSSLPSSLAFYVPAEKNETYAQVPVNNNIPSFTTNSFVHLPASDSVQANPVDILHDKKTPPVDSLPTKPSPVYRYTDYRAYYKLHYLADLLVVDYGDSVTRLKLNPVLEGVPASFETSSQWKMIKATEKQEPFVVVTENLYLQKLEKGMQAFGRSEWHKAKEVFSALSNENPGDQNALFYGALCAYENGDYAEVVDLMLALKKVPQTIFEQDADYYIALALLKSGQAHQAQEYLQRLAASDSFYKNKAVELMKESR